MIPDVFLGLISLALLGAFSFYVWNDRKEHSKMINAIKSNTSQEFVNSELTDKVKIDTKPQEQDTPIEDIPDDKYIDLITNSEGADRV